ncbi:MAG TPA: Gfo/Idh/MocA family oxidoreductase [Thermomicrobiales bacterium]|nr:Gfo/Idh/MocA family oxidoreductase [Thermomicrobiales bacterium]
MTTPSPLRLGIIGTGLAVEQLHWPALRRMTDRYRITAFADIDRDHAHHFAEYSGASMDDFTPDYHDLLLRDDIDAVLISLPIANVAQVLRDTIEMGKHTICEKPPGATDEQARALLDVERAHPDQKVLISENYFYRDDVRLAKSLVEHGILGRIHLMTCMQAATMQPEEGQFSGTPWRMEGNYTGGVHLDGGVHQMAQIRMLMGDARHLSAEIQDANDLYGGPSDLILTLRFVNGAIGSYVDTEPANHVPFLPSEMRIYGTEGTMVIGGKTVAIHREHQVETWSLDDMDGGYFGEFLNFHEAVTGNADIVGTLAQSIRTMELVTQGIRSAETGQVITLRDDDRLGPLSEHPLPLWLPQGQSSLEVNARRHVTSR